MKNISEVRFVSFQLIVSLVFDLVKCFVGTKQPTLLASVRASDWRRTQTSVKTPDAPFAAGLETEAGESAQVGEGERVKVGESEGEGDKKRRLLKGFG